MPGRQLYIEFVDSRARGIITLYEENAPTTCETLWNALANPVRITAIHAMFAGPEIMMGLPQEAQTFDPTAIPAENQTCFPEAGECLWFYQGKNVMKGLTDELWEIGVFYDAGARIHGPLGWTPCNMFGKITSGLEEFANACRTTRTEGIKTIEIGRL
ncbi:DUF3830 family protein [Rhodobium gokarnense]|uniref:DUF3830 family protein n=1 Tax=Rhodobium gokarnense TaxID=364296 RepID=A0ABT3H6K6_9HYPH|nr:DUF3830 family protein [Rhodobium gokarnense]MCW2305956.1 hypothetical protein [Rhodobium gokarnense]